MRNRDRLQCAGASIPMHSILGLWVMLLAHSFCVFFSVSKSFPQEKMTKRIMLNHQSEVVFTE